MPPTPNWNKFDTGLLLLYSSYLQAQSADPTAGPAPHPALQANAEQVHLSLEYEGNLAALVEAGFAPTHHPAAGLAEGIVRYADLAAFSQLGQVRKLRYGRVPQLLLDKSTVEILARGSQGAWTVDQNTLTFTGHTGEGVLIGVIDTGIDWKHRSFLEEKGEGTRILRIWDMGLEPQNGEQGPDPTLLSGPPTYGVEYSKDTIDKVLREELPATTIRHRDCHFHGTHVAGIAASNGREPALSGRPPLEFAGVAPKAQLVVVKHDFLEHDPSAKASPTKLFKDAIIYILKVAEAAKKPVVINCSFGSDTGPCDGLDEDSPDGEHTFLDNTFTEAAAGQVCVFGAANSAGRRQHAEIVMPKGGAVDIPFEVFDDRVFMTDFYNCSATITTFTLGMSIYYPATDATADVTTNLQTPGQDFFSEETSLTMAPIVNREYDETKKFTLRVTQDQVKRKGLPVKRNHIELLIFPDKHVFQTGSGYKLRVSAPEGTVMQLWCSFARTHGVRLAATLPAGITVNDQHTIGVPCDAVSVITVGSYDTATDRLACFSSQGPLADYSGLGPVADKPDITAPGVSIFSTRSYDARVSIADLSETSRMTLMLNGALNFNYRAATGTSMSAPFVTGVVALMLGKNPKLTTSQVRQRLRDTARGLRVDAQRALCSDPANPQPTDPLATAAQAGAGKVNAKAAIPDGP